ncbi:right-handed parallel beta-helix repeat-containing protein [Streptomyces sp. NPDC002928]|uniref:right-handed parallel beta-helix repeat-containing protein n=1 Tax=Streptomyces sp. NPDC002928 TaxID=3154440 RepID=UPI0033A585B3
MKRRSMLLGTGGVVGAWGAASLAEAPRAAAVGTASVFDVRGYGAAGDGSTDDTSAFVQAFGAARAAAPGATVLVPPGSYLVGASLVMGTGMTVSAYGARITRLADSGALLKNFDASTNAPGYSGAGNLTVLGGIWDMAGDVYTRTSDAMGFGHCQDILVQDCTILRVPSAHAVELNAVRRARIVDCVFDGLDATNTTRSEKEAVQITGAISEASLPCPPYDNTPCTDVLISGCTLVDSPHGLFGALCGDHGGKAGVVHTGVRVLGNLVEAAAGHGVRAVDWSGSVVHANTVMRAQISGIRIESLGGNPLSALSVDGNIITDTGTDSSTGGGIVIAAAVTDLSLSGNVVSRVQGETGIYVRYARRATITGNTVSESVKGTGVSNCQGIHVQHSPGVVIAQNTVADCAGDGIGVDAGLSGAVMNGDAPLVSGNRIDGVAGHGIAVGCPDAAVRDNHVTGANTSDSTATYGIRLGGAAANMSCQGNVVRQTAGQAAATAAIAVLPGSKGTWVTGNDLRGWGSTALLDQGTGTLTTTGNATE